MKTGFQPNDALRAIQARMRSSAASARFHPNGALRAVQARMARSRTRDPGFTIQRKGWTWNGTSWVPDSGSTLPQPGTRGAAPGARLVTFDPPTTADVVADCADTPLSIGAYNRGHAYAVSAFGFTGHRAHSSNHVHDHPRARLSEMAAAGASVAELREVARLWGR